MPFYSGNYGGPLGQFDPRPMMQAASAQAQMYQNLGSQFGNVISKYFKKKEETKMVESMAENPIAQQVVWPGGNAPTDPKERIKDIRGIVRASGGPAAFMARMENAELKTQNKQIIDQNTALKAEQLRGLEQARLEREKQIKATDAFNRWAFKEQPGQLTPQAQQQATALRRFDPRARDFASAVPPMGPSQRLDPSGFVDIARQRSAVESTRGPSQTPILQPSNRFLQSATEADLSPDAMKKAYEFAQQKATQETARDTARLSGLESREKVIQLIDKPTADLRKEFQALPPVKDFNKVNAAYNKIKSSFAALRNLNTEEDRKKAAAADMAMIFSYMKILDPGSTVREGEYASAQQTTGLPGKLRNWFNKAVSGEILNDDQRGAFQAMARNTAQAQFDDLNIQINLYKSIADKKEIDVSRVIPQEYLTIAKEGLPGLPSTGGGGGGGGTGGPVTTKSGFIVGDVTPIKPVQPAPTAPPAQSQAPTTAQPPSDPQLIAIRAVQLLEQQGLTPDEILDLYENHHDSNFRAKAPAIRAYFDSRR